MRSHLLLVPHDEQLCDFAIVCESQLFVSLNAHPQSAAYKRQVIESKQKLLLIARSYSAAFLPLSLICSIAMSTTQSE